MIEGLLSGLGLGLATGTACLATCGPVYGAYLMGERREGLEPLRVIFLLNLGRFLAYAMFGALVGLLGGSLPASIRMPVAVAGYLFFSAYLLLSVIRQRRSCSGCRTGKVLEVTRSPFLLGVLTGFSICPAFLVALTGAFESSGPLTGMMLFIGFFAGTTVYMLPFAIFGLLTRREWITKVARVAAVVVAIYFGAVGVRGLVGWIQGGVPLDDRAVPTPEEGSVTAAEIWSVEEAESIYVLSFTGMDEDHGTDLMPFLEGDAIPPAVLVETDSASWREAIASVPDLSPVILPHLADPRADAERAPWWHEVADSIEGSRLRAFAVSYEPWCVDRGEGVTRFLSSYSFRCSPDSGFTFLMLNPLACDPTDCATCPAAN